MHQQSSTQFQHPMSLNGVNNRSEIVKYNTGCPPALLHLVMSYQLDLAARRAGTVYLKNMIIQHWVSNGDGASAEFVIHDSDKNVIRDNIIKAVIVSETLSRYSWLRV